MVEVGAPVVDPVGHTLGAEDLGGSPGFADVLPRAGSGRQVDESLA